MISKSHYMMLRGKVNCRNQDIGRANRLAKMIKISHSCLRFQPFCSETPRIHPPNGASQRHGLCGPDRADLTLWMDRGSTLCPESLPAICLEHKLIRDWHHTGLVHRQTRFPQYRKPDHQTGMTAASSASLHHHQLPPAHPGCIASAPDSGPADGTRGHCHLLVSQRALFSA
jgi:hypothetical protein